MYIKLTLGFAKTLYLLPAPNSQIISKIKASIPLDKHVLRRFRSTIIHYYKSKKKAIDKTLSHNQGKCKKNKF